MANKSATKKTASRASGVSARFRSTGTGNFIIRFKKSSPRWQANLENNLVEEGLTRSKARELVRLAAS